MDGNSRHDVGIEDGNAIVEGENCVGDTLLKVIISPIVLEVLEARGQMCCGEVDEVEADSESQMGR